MKVFKEFWRTAVIDGVENPRYQVSNMGRIKCLDWRYTGKEKICKLSVNSDGYLVVGIDGVIKYAHRIVAETFLPCPNPERNCIDHATTIRTSNIVLLDDDGNTILYTSLRFCTHSENNRNPLTRIHMSENSAMLGKLGAEHPKSISIIQLTLDGKFIRKWGSACEVQRELGIYQGNVTKCCRGKRNVAGGYKWKYASDFQKVCKRSISQINPLF